MTWLSFAIVCAFFSGSRDLFAKSRTQTVPSSLVALLQYLLAIPILIAAAISEGVPSLQAGFYPALLGAALFLGIGSLFYFRAIQLSDVSLMTPLRSLTLPCLMLIAPFLIGEVISVNGGIGVVVITIGLFIVSYSSTDKFAFTAYREAEGTKYMIVTIFVFSLCAICEKVGVQASSSLFFFCCETILGTLVIACVMLSRKQLTVQDIRTHWLTVAPVAICFALMFIFQSLSLATGPVTYVIAIKRAGVVFTVLCSTLYMGEGSGLQRTLGAVVVLIGAFFIGSN